MLLLDNTPMFFVLIIHTRQTKIYKCQRKFDIYFRSKLMTKSITTSCQLPTDQNSTSQNKAALWTDYGR